LPTSHVNFAALPWKMQKVIFRQYSAVISIQQLIFQTLKNVHHFKTVNIMAMY